MPTRLSELNASTAQADRGRQKGVETWWSLPVLCRRNCLHSITSFDHLVGAGEEGGRSRCRGLFAIFRALIASSNLVGSSTGRSAACPFQKFVHVGGRTAEKFRNDSP